MPRFACARVLSVCFIIHSVHVAFARSFAFINICRKVDKRTEEKDKNAISPDDKHFGFYQWAICDSQFAKPLIYLQLYCSKWFSGGTFQSIYFFPNNYHTNYDKHTTSIRTNLTLPWKGVQRSKRIYENIQTTERRNQYTRSIKYCKTFSSGKIQHNIQRDKFTSLSPTNGQLSYQHWKKILYASF